jgi:cytochrome c1
MKRLLIMILFAFGCRERTNGYALIGDAQRGHALLDRYGCRACHTVPGPGIEGVAGPPLDRMATRRYIAGHFPNVPQNLVVWIRAPQTLKPGTAMPNLGVTERDARDLAAYLYTLQ